MAPKNPLWFGFFRRASEVLIVLVLLAVCPLCARSDVFTHVPEATTGNYQLLYTLPVLNAANYQTGTPAYSVDNSASVTGSISRVAYYMELQTPGGQLQYAYVSMAAFTQNPKLLGIPTAASGAYFNQSVYDMHVFSNVDGITTGSEMIGNLEFFHTDYTSDSVADVPNADDTVDDWGDDPNGPHGPGNYGSFQIANPLQAEEIICYNNWGGDGGDGDIGLGTNFDTNPDWTYTNNAAAYTVKNIQVLVQLGPAPARSQVMPLGDSITDGYQSASGSGYRTPLYTALAGTGRAYDFVGSSGDNSTETLTDASEQQHEGHNGYRIDQITVNIDGTNGAAGNDGGYWLGDNPGVHPKYILVHVGTNDINEAYDPTTANPTNSQFIQDMIGRLEAMLNTIIAQRPNSHILLAGIVPVRSSDTTLELTALFNQAIQDEVIPNAAYAGKLTYVDQYDSFFNGDGTVDTSLYADNIHPNDAGYQVMANNWFNTIDTLDTALPLLSGVTATSASTTSTVVSGTINSSGQSTTYYVQYGPTTNYGSMSAVQTISGTFADAPFGVTLSGLTPNTIYQYQVVTTTRAGITVTDDAFFLSGSNLPVNRDQPVITSYSSASVTIGRPFSYQITATNTPASFDALGLPPGVSIDTVTGLLSGTPRAAGDFNVYLSATNAMGTGAGGLFLKVAALPPVAKLSATKASVKAGSGEIAEFRVKLSSPQTEAITVNYRVKGDAINGVDYTLLNGKRPIRAGRTMRPIKLIPLGDLDGAARKTVILTLTPGKGYKLEGQRKMTITIVGKQ